MAAPAALRLALSRSAGSAARVICITPKRLTRRTRSRPASSTALERAREWAARIVVHDVELAEGVERELHRALVRPRSRVVAAHERRRRSRSPSRPHHRASSEMSATTTFAPAAREALRDGAADARAGAGHQARRGRRGVASRRVLCLAAVLGGRVISISAATRPRRWRYCPSMNGSSVRHRRSASDSMRVKMMCVAAPSCRWMSSQTLFTASLPLQPVALLSLVLPAPGLVGELRQFAARHHDDPHHHVGAFLDRALHRRRPVARTPATAPRPPAR